MVYPSLQDPYSVAITSYALALAGELQGIDKLITTSTGNYWNDPSSRFISIEATSYALLTLIHMKHLNFIDRIVQWLTEQNFYGDTTGQTQATVMMFQAIAQYYRVVPTTQDVDRDILLQFPMWDNERFRIVANTISTYSRQMSVQEDCIITAKGKGLATLTIIQSYYSVHAKKDCDHYDLSVTAREEYLDVMISQILRPLEPRGEEASGNGLAARQN
ncbi:PREDICTED: cobra venom factor-like [Nanorana parkeri]|uniref:cobra venom factor-like n=1 Tax=Nanorana parkeri TaxID=125878 RepID=UPI000854C1C7|nr:PREDICTED: cobra venom factor-like [Nanorana parkeri]